MICFQRRANRDFIEPRIDISDVVCKSISIQVSDRNGATHKRCPGSQMLETRMHVTNSLGLLFANDR